MAVADNALERAKHAEKELSKAMGEVEGLFTRVWKHRRTEVTVLLDFKYVAHTVYVLFFVSTFF